MTKKLNKIIFLDHDGVVCLSDQWGSRFKKARKWMMDEGLSEHAPNVVNEKTRPIHVRLDNFDEKAVKILNRILEETDAEIVVSSDWKLHATLEEMQELYRLYGVNKVPIAFTPRLEDFDPDSSGLFRWKGWLERARCLEIQHWLKENEVDTWVAVDDLNMSNEVLRPGLDYFVLTPRSMEGIKQSGIADKIIKILNNETTIE
jgi:hypothetical protein